MENENRNKDIIEIDILALVRVIWKQKWILILCALIGAFIALAATNFLITPTYRSSFNAYVNNYSANMEEQQTINSGDTYASQSLATTYAQIIMSRTIIEDAIDRSGLDYSYRDVQGGITASVQSDTQLVIVAVILEDPEDAFRLCQAMAKVAPEYIAEIVEGSSMKIVTSPVYPEGRFSPNVKKNVVIGFAIGLLIAIFGIIIYALSDDRVKSERELRERFGVPIVGTIPNIDTISKNKGYYAYNYSDDSRKEKQK